MQPTRPQLIPLEGQLVYSTGRIKDWKRSPDFDDILLINVKLWRWDGQAVVDLQRSPDATADHLWLRCDRGTVAAERLTQTFGIGRIAFYTRADGTYDLGLQAKPCTNLDELVAEAQSVYADRYKLGTQAMREALKLFTFAFFCACEQGTKSYAFSRVKTLPEAIDHLHKRLTYIENSIEATESRLDAQAHCRRGPCRGLDLAKPKARARRSAAAGF